MIIIENNVDIINEVDEKELELYEIKTDVFPSNDNEKDGSRLLLKYPTDIKTLNNKRTYFEEDGCGWWSDDYCGWIYPYSNYNLDYCISNFAVWKGELNILH